MSAPSTTRPGSATTGFHDQARTVVAELAAVFERVEEDQLEPVLSLLQRHQRIFVLGIGREGLASKAFAMRLTHLGKTVHWGWDDTTPAVTSDDLFWLASGPANIPHLHYVAEQVKKTGATLVVVTAIPDGPTAVLADAVIRLPAHTYGAEGDVVPTVQAMGSLFEQSLFVFYDLLYAVLRERVGASFEELIARHRNFE